MKNKFLDIAYKHYPKGVNFLTEERNINQKYIESKEHQLLEGKRSGYYDRNQNFGAQIIEILYNHGVDIEFRDASRIISGDRAFWIQHSGFFYEKELKYYPLCFVFSGIAPYFHSYFVDIDISFDKPIVLGGYKWKRNNGILYDWKKNPSFASIENSVSKVIHDHLGFQKFPESLVEETIPDISNSNIEHGKFTFFNAFFLDDFDCLP